jgi:SAM-dependent methyltransferase
MLYDKAYYASIGRAAESSAKVIVPLVQDLIGPRSVLDVGCGNGIWLDAYRRAGVADCFGVDGAGAEEVLRIPEDHFSVRDLTIPLDLGRQFDLVQSLEVAEHLPALSAGNFIRSLTRHGDVVLFSAAIPYQGGTGHLNEQWPDYWAGLFRERGFEPYDWLRPQVWGDGRVAWWYAQNTLLFVRSGARLEWVRRLPPAAPVGPGLRMVHPNRYLGSAKRSDVPRPVAECLDMQPWRSTPSSQPARPYDVAVVIPTVGRSSLDRAVRSVYAQKFPGTIQILIGVDGSKREAGQFEELAHVAPPNCSLTVFDPGYSTSARRGGFVPSGTGGALRTILSYAAHSRLLAYLDDDNWWGPEHLATLVQAMAGHDWAYSLRWFVDAQTEMSLCIDRWESVGPDAGVFAKTFGGFVDPSCLMIDKVACEPVLRLWCSVLSGDKSGMSSDRPVFAYLRSHGRSAGTGRATAYYVLNASDVNHHHRMCAIASVQSRQGAKTI